MLRESSDNRNPEYAMELHVFAAFVVATAIMISLPGPSVLLTIAHSLSFGGRKALATVAGATAGVAAQLAIAAIGLVSLLQVMAGAFDWLRWAGALYLIYLGIKQWRSAGMPAEGDAPAASGTSLFVQGLIITTFNPKSLIFIAAFLPQFIDASQPLGVQIAIIVPTFLVITFGVTSIWVIAAGNARRFFRSPRAFRIVSRVSGSLMIGAGVGLALARR